MWERLELIIPRFAGAVGAGLAVWSVAKTFTIDNLTLDSFAVLITAAFAGYSLIHKLVSSKMNPGDAANVSVMQAQKAEEEAHNEST